MIVNGIQKKFNDDGLAGLGLAVIKRMAPKEQYRNYARLAEYDLTKQSSHSLSISNQIKAYKRGFSCDSYITYDFDDFDHSDYLTDTDRLNSSSSDVMGDFSDFCNNKVATHYIFHEFKSYLPTIFGVIYNGNLVEREDYNIREILDSSPLVIKGIRGSQGDKVMIIEKDSGGRITTRTGSQTDLEINDAITEFDSAYISEFVRQAEYSNHLYPSSTNTLRIVTMVDPKTNDVFIPCAVQRIGSSTTDGFDNWSQGGLSSAIDLENGTLGQAAELRDGELIWHEKHPDTDVKIKGTKIPHWNAVHDTLLNIINQHKFMSYVGWDIVITDDGFKILEINGNPDVNLLQVHKPLLTDKRVEQFFDFHGMLNG